MLQRARGLDLVDVISAPTSVVVVGASVATESRAGRALAYLNRLGYEGAIHVVHPREDSILGYPAVRQVADLPLSIDMAMINTPAESVPLLVRELDDRGVRVAISIASGFEDRSLPIRRELSDAISERTIRLIGPNCTGVMAPASAGYLSTSSFLQHYTPRLGGIALVSQSGGMGNGLLATAFKRGAGISHLITTGDEIDVGCLEVIAGLLRRTDVTAVGALIEGVTDHEWLEHVALGIKETEKRVYFLRMAKTDAGRVAAGAHTGRVVGQADIATAVLGEAGMVEVSNMEELGDVLLCSDLFRPPARGRVSIVSCSGASAALAADQVGMSLNLSIPQPLAESMQVSKAEFDLALNFANPLDVPGHDTLRFARALVLARELPDFDAVLGISTSLAHDPDVLIAELGSGPRPRTPLLLTFLSPDDSFAAEKVAALARHGTATIPTPQRAIRALELLTKGVDEHARSEADNDQVHLVGIEGVRAADAARLLPWARWKIVANQSDAAEAAEAFGYPVVLKVAGRKLFHRSETGGVVANVTTASLDRAFSQIALIAKEYGDAVMVQEQAKPGFEIMLSVLDNPEFGLVAVLRPGGVLAELMNAQVILSTQWPAERRIEILRRSKLGRILNGYRGGKRYDLVALAELAHNAMRLVETTDLQFVEFNPVILGPEGAAVVDAIARRQ